MNFDDVPPELIDELNDPATLLDSEPAGPFEAFFAGAGVLSGLFLLFFVLVLALIITLWVRNYRAAKKAGVDIFTVQTDIAAKASKSALLAPAKSKEERLQELADLRTKALITAEEYAEARRTTLLG